MASSKKSYIIWKLAEKSISKVKLFVIAFYKNDSPWCIVQWGTLSEIHLLRLRRISTFSGLKITKGQYNHKHSSALKWYFDRIKNKKIITFAHFLQNSEKLAGSVWPSLSLVFRLFLCCMPNRWGRVFKKKSVRDGFGSFRSVEVFNWVSQMSMRSTKYFGLPITRWFA